jgi:hypothetical protein
MVLWCCGGDGVSVQGGMRAVHTLKYGARTDACGRSFAVLSTQVSPVGLRLRLVVPRPMPAALSFAVLWTQVSTVGLRLG